MLISKFDSFAMAFPSGSSQVKLLAGPPCVVQLSVTDPFLCERNSDGVMTTLSPGDTAEGRPVCVRIILSTGFISK